VADAGQVERLKGLEDHLLSRVIEQDHAMSRLAAMFRRGELGLSSGQRPKGSVFLTGPTGSGKTESFVTAVSYALGRDRFVPFDMSEYQDESALGKFLGKGPEDPGLLGRALLAHSAAAFFFDEVEKAHRPLLDVFLQILWEGRVTVGTGQTFTFGEHYIGFGSNLGGVEAMRMQHSSRASVEAAVLRAVRQTLRPEMIARIDEVLVFRRLSADGQRKICAREFEREAARLRPAGCDLAISREALEFLVREGFDPQFGARPLRTTVERQVRDAVADSLLATGVTSGRLEFDPIRRRLRLNSDNWRVK
jgi:ATP-dependent Clp protease ATP-binding subunit ClpB